MRRVQLPSRRQWQQLFERTSLRTVRMQAVVVCHCSWMHALPGRNSAFFIEYTSPHFMIGKGKGKFEVIYSIYYYYLIYKYYVKRITLNTRCRDDGCNPVTFNTI